MALRPSDIPPATVRALSAGHRETANLAESLAIDFAKLLAAVSPSLPADALAQMAAAGSLGVTRRMAVAASILLDLEGPSAFERLASHPSDTARGWACYVLASLPRLALADRLDRVRPLAADPHFGVREWAWLALRPHIVAEPLPAIAHLAPWTASEDASLRRFASEATRPRGVWSAHIPALRSDPAPAIAILEPLRADPAKYVQDSVANWLNDAAKDHQAWVVAVTDRWLAESPAPATARIAQRARRSLAKA